VFLQAVQHFYLAVHSK